MIFYRVILCCILLCISPPLLKADPSCLKLQWKFPLCSHSWSPLPNHCIPLPIRLIHLQQHSTQALPDCVCFYFDFPALVSRLWFLCCISVPVGPPNIGPTDLLRFAYCFLSLVCLWLTGTLPVPDQLWLHLKILTQLKRELLLSQIDISNKSICLPCACWAHK